jgi:hypothetical protein
MIKNGIMVEKETMMTVNELIQQLQTYPGDMRVLTLGYEGGFDDIGLRMDNIVFNVNSEDTWYMGKHETVDMCDEYDKSGTKCVIVMRGK